MINERINQINPILIIETFNKIGQIKNEEANLNKFNSVDSKGFADEVLKTLKEVSSIQHHSDHLQTQVQLDNPKVSLEETMLTIQKAQIGFQSVLQTRNRLMQAYSDIMNMQV